MYPPCVSVNEYLIPETRKRVSKLLKKNGMSENNIAKKLHISQGLVSRYIRQRNSEFLSKEIDEISEELTKRILENYDEKDNTELFCNFCIRTRETGKFCDLHSIKNCNLCFYLYDPRKIISKNTVIRELKLSFEELSSMDVNEIMPEVRMNIVYSVENPRSIMDVAAFPGRLTYANNRLIAYGDPEFGASRHMSGILISAMAIDPEKRSLINIKFNERFIQKLKESGNKIGIMDRNRYENVEDFIKEKMQSYDVIVDPGSFGIEPEIYIFGKDPRDIIKKLKNIIKGR